MIETKQKLQSYLKYEKEVYSNYMFQTKIRYVLSRIKREPARMIFSFLKYSRKCDFYNLQSKKSRNFFYSLYYLYYVIRKNNLGEKLGLEIDTMNTEEGLMIYHYNNVINGGSVIGRNCHIHGNNCIGNDGKSNECPTIGNNVTLGVGAKIIGGVTIADNITIGAGAVVVHSFKEKGILIAGVPAKKIK